jgi:SAM-dependent methyltransferase
MLKKLLAHPLTRGLESDDPRVTELRRRIIKENKFLRGIYEEWYGDLIAAVPASNPSAPPAPGQVLELGSGGGFLKEMLPECITSEVFPCGGADMVVDARALPFADGSLRAILMVDVFHHIPDVMEFLREAERTLAPGGVIAMWEPWNTPWSGLIYSRLHPEPFGPCAANWSFPASGPLSGANGALPWIVFERDKAEFEEKFSGLKMEKLKLDYPFSYLASGGVSMRALAPGRLFPFARILERGLSRFAKKLAMFAFIVVRRTGTAWKSGAFR